MVPEIRQYDCGLFQVSVCQRCFDHRIDHDPRYVFHGIDGNYLNEQSSPILEPKGKPQAFYYKTFFPKKMLHLGSLFLTGLFEEKQSKVFFGFDVERLKGLDGIRYMDFDVWENLGFHLDSFSKKEKNKLMKRLFLEGYSQDNPKTEVLLPRLDTGIATVVITRDEFWVNCAQDFAQKGLDATVLSLEDIDKMLGKREYIGCDCGVGNWK